MKVKDDKEIAVGDRVKMEEGEEVFFGTVVSINETAFDCEFCGCNGDVLVKWDVSGESDWEYADELDAVG